MESDSHWQMKPLEDLIGYTFQERKLLLQALTHRSMTIGTGQPNYEDLEAYGDALLTFLYFEVVTAVWNAGPRLRFWARNKILSNESLARLCHQWGIAGYVVISPTDRRSAEKRKVYADVIEALVYAIYKDGGMESAQAFVERFFGPIPIPGLATEDRKTYLEKKAARKEARAALRERYDAALANSA